LISNFVKMNIIKIKKNEYNFFFQSDEFVINIKEKTILRKYRLGGNLVGYHAIGVEEKEIVSENFYKELRLLKLERINENKRINM